ncbi:hypothetical protein GLW08_03105 [Pontibacillus yanchengensis]|uniref:Uncharacterized protein n=2 Tax=Pontibacillus yanchengensis TaxID=462910 RepID=A0ACC7VDN2_9BACI|nr:hypothetical protein [Pontibacillus yanchengensis]MYL34694.1 hypothetical protein [Pontibacillus yanchengensis]MYL52321.1 hypothetical protein [Pontibacillus yanchengensis]
MLQATLTDCNNTLLQVALQDERLKSTSKCFTFGEGQICNLYPNLEENSLLIQFRGDLTLEQYRAIHHLIKSIQERTVGDLDESECLLGYLGNGEGAYIVTNWEEWSTFLLRASLRTLEGQKVRVLDKGQEIGSGMLAEYDIIQSDGGGCIPSCKLITLFGERTFKGEALQIIPTNEW